MRGLKISLASINPIPLFYQDSHAGIPVEGGSVGVKVVVLRLLHFIGSLLCDRNVVQSRRKAASLDATTLPVSQTTYNKWSCNLSCDYFHTHTPIGRTSGCGKALLEQDMDTLPTPQVCILLRGVWLHMCGCGIKGGTF